jgi:hypothetical protein
MRWRRMLILLLVTLAVAAVAGLILGLFNASSAVTETVGAVLLVVIVFAGTPYAFPDLQAHRDEEDAEHSEVAADEPTDDAQASPRGLQLSEEFRALDWKRKIWAYFGFLDVEVYAVGDDPVEKLGFDGESNEEEKEERGGW